MNNSYCGPILAALLLSGAGARFLAESNFSLIVLLFFVAIIFFSLTLGPSPEEREARHLFYNLTFVIKHFVQLNFVQQLPSHNSSLLSSPFPSPLGGEDRSGALIY